MAERRDGEDAGRAVNAAPARLLLALRDASPAPPSAPGGLRDEASDRSA